MSDDGRVSVELLQSERRVSDDLRQRNDALRDEIERLRREEAEIYGQARREFAAEIERLKAKHDERYCAMLSAQFDNGRLRALVKDLADDLEDELRGHYGPVMDYPSEKRRFERDMANVYEARRELEGK